MNPIKVRVKGRAGIPGPVVNLEVGGVSTLPPGSDATVTIGGSGTTRSLDFGIPRGDTGAGDPGPAPNITIGSVVTLNPADPATASITGTTPDLTLNLGIPRGQQGTPGEGTGDMLAANNLADLNNADTALTNLGGTTVGKAVFKAVDGAAARTAIGAGPGTVTSVATGTGLTGGPITSTGSVALASIAAGSVLANTGGSSAAPSAVDIDTTFKTALGLTAANVGLGNVNNTSDADKPVSTATQTALDAKSAITRTVRVITGTSDTPTLADAGAYLRTTSSSAVVITIPTDASVAYQVGTQIDVFQAGTGALSLTGATGVSINGVSAGSETLAAQFSAATLIKTAANTWDVMGALA